MLPGNLSLAPFLDMFKAVQRRQKHRQMLLVSQFKYKKIGLLAFSHYGLIFSQERSDQAVYCDAHVIEIQRRLHDIKGCRCIFVVRYDHDHGEVNLVYPEQVDPFFLLFLQIYSKRQNKQSTKLELKTVFKNYFLNLKTRLII